MVVISNFAVPFGKTVGIIFWTEKAQAGMSLISANSFTQKQFSFFPTILGSKKKHKDGVKKKNLNCINV